VLALPPTIKIPSAEELYPREDAVEILAKRAAANITQGFTVHRNKTILLPYTFLSEININNNKLWDVFIALAGDMPADVCCMYGLYDGEDETTTTGYFNKAEVLGVLNKYRTELTMDATIEFGLIHQSKRLLSEIFISESKYIKFWGTDLQKFLQHMQSFGLQQIDDLAFIDEYPKIVTPLQKFMPNTTRPAEVVRSLNRSFGIHNK